MEETINEDVFHRVIDACEKPFCRLVSMTTFSRRNFSSRIAMILCKSLPTAEVRAVGCQLAGTYSSPPSKISVIRALDQESGPISFSRKIFKNKVARK